MFTIRSAAPRVASAAALGACCVLLSASARAGAFAYPETRAGDVVDDYHGVKVADPYRWLEESDDPEVRAWVEAQNAFTRGYLDAIEGREALRARLQRLNDYERWSVPFERGERFFYTVNPGLRNQALWYVQDGMDGEPRLLLDPNTLREDGTGAVTGASASRDGRFLAWGVSWSGSDWTEYRIREVETGEDLSEVIPWTKFTIPAWTENNAGFYYSRQPEPGTVPPGDEHYFPKLCFHRLGDDPAEDRIVYERPDRKELGFRPFVTHDGRHLVVQVRSGSADRHEIHVSRSVGSGEVLEPVASGFDAAYEFAGSDGDRILLRTNLDAPRWRIVAVDMRKPARGHWVTLVPEGRDVITGAEVAGGRLLVKTLHNATDRLALFSLDGTPLREIALPVLGTASVSGRPDSRHLFVGLASFVHPGTIYRFDVETGEFAVFREARVDFDPAAFIARQVWYESKDGTRVSMFLVHRRSLVFDGNNPTLLYGYGGFNISMTPSFSAARVAWLERGGIYAVANLRGGGEYGEAWHRDGMLERKQNVFDDFIAAAEYLVAQGYTRPERLAIEGGSNGGLLTAACMVQRPDLFGVVITAVPVVDMLRYHRFTVARFWIPEYGSAEDPDQFAFLHAYSPLHNVKPGTTYPAVLVTTADTDDRVHPGQAKKYAATLQAAGGSDRPALIRIETRAGHGGGKPTSKRIDEAVDTWSFILHAMGLLDRAAP